MSRFYVLLIALWLFSFSGFSIAQDVSEKPSDDLVKEIRLVEEVLSDVNSLKLPENRAVVFAEVGGYFCKTDQKRAAKLFQKSIADLVLAQQEVELIKKNPNAFEQIIYGQNPRISIIEIISVCDPELAIEALRVSRPAKLSQLIAQSSNESDRFSNQSYFVDNEYRNEQRYIKLAAEKDPKRAVKLFRESIKKAISYETLSFLQKIFEKDPKTANTLAEEVFQKLLDQPLSTNNYQATSTAQYFLDAFSKEQSTEQESIEVAESSVRNLADKISAFWLEKKNFGYGPQSSGFKVIEKYFPARAAKLKQGQAGSDAQEYQKYFELIQSSISPTELLAHAEKFQSYKASIYITAAQKYGQNGNISEALNLINSKFSEEDAKQQLSNFYSGLANQEISKENYVQAISYIDQIPQEQTRFSILLQFAANVFQKDKDGNKQLALSTLDQAFSLIDTTEISQQEITNFIEIASALAPIEPVKAFQTMELIVPKLNEFTKAYSVVAQFRNEQMQRNGEFLIGHNGSMMGAYNLGYVLGNLGQTDFEKSIQMVNNFDSGETRIALKLEIIRGISNLPGNANFSNFRR